MHKEEQEICIVYKVRDNSSRMAPPTAALPESIICRESKGLAINLGIQLACKLPSCIYEQHNELVRNVEG